MIDVYCTTLWEQSISLRDDKRGPVHELYS